MVNAPSRPVKKTGVRQSTEVRFSDRGYAYAQSSRSGEISGLVNTFESSKRPLLSDIPRGILILNSTTSCLEVSDPGNDRWVSFCASGTGGTVGLPTDGSFTDGPVVINPSGTIADALDAINEYLNTVISITFASHLGTTDGNTNGVLNPPTFNLGRVASPSTFGNPFFTGTWDTDSNRDITRDASITWALVPGQAITDLNQGTISARFFNGNNTLIHTETLSPDDTLNDQTSLPNVIISITDLVQIGSKKEGYISLNINAATLLAGSSGYLRVELEHVVGIDTYAHPDLEFFRDANAAPTITSQSITLSSSPLKYLSGVRFATISGINRPQVTIAMLSNNIWSDTYRADPITIQSINFGIPNYNVPYNSTAVSKASISPPTSPFVFNQDFTYSELREITGTNILNPNAAGTYLQMNIVVRDPFTTVNGANFGSSPAILLNTLPNQSTSVSERFTDENFRLESSSSGTLVMTSISGIGRGADAWDSTLSLNSRNGLQVINGALVYPKFNFTSTVPASNPNYTAISGSAGDLSYVRRFTDPAAMSRSNGILRIDGLSEVDRAAKNILVEIRVVGTHIPGNGIQDIGNEGTGWLSLNDDYNSGTFLGDDGDGCFVTTQSQVQPFFEFTLGGFSTAYAANMAIEVRVTFKNPVALNRSITRLEITNWI